MLKRNNGETESVEGKKQPNEEYIRTLWEKEVMKYFGKLEADLV